MSAEEYQEMLVQKLLKGEKLSDEEFLRLDPRDPRNVPKRHTIDPTGDGKFAMDLEFRSGLPNSAPPMMMMKLPSMLPELCKHKWCELDHPKYRKLHVEPMMGIKIDLINDDKISRTANRQPLHPDDVKLMDMCKPFLGDDWQDVVGPRYFEAKDLPVPEKVLAKLAKEEADRSARDARGDDGFMGPENPMPFNDEPSTEDLKIVKSEMSKKRDEAAKDASWLKNTTYLSNDLSQRVHDFTSDVQEKGKLEAIRKAAKFDVDDEAYQSTAVVQKAEDSFRQVKNYKPSKQVEWEVPILPEFDAGAVDGTRVLVSFDDEPPSENDDTELPSRLVSKVQATKVKKRGQNVMSAALSLKEKETEDEATYKWSRQYQVRVVKDGTERISLTVTDQAATYQFQAAGRFELDKCRLPETARLDDDAMLDKSWSGETHIKFVDTTAFTIQDRNALRDKKRRQGDPNVSDDEIEEMAIDKTEEEKVISHDSLFQNDDEPVPPIPIAEAEEEPAKEANSKKRMADLFGDDDDEDDD